MSNTPINISALERGMVVRIQLQRGLVIEGVGPGVAEVRPNQRPRPYRRSSMVGYVMSNNFTARQLQIDFQDLTFPDMHFVATVLYKQIAVIEKQLEGTHVSDNVHRLRIPAYVPVLGVF